MHKRCIRRRLPVLIFTFFIILYVDFQLRTSSLPKLNAVNHPTLRHRAVQQDPSSSEDAQNPASNSSTGGNTQMATEDVRVSQPKLKQEDIFIAVKTTGKFHTTRLALLLETWISRTKAHVSLCCVCAVMGRTENSYTLRHFAASIQTHLLH